MAGLGRKTWSAGEVATAANIQGYLQDQTVMKFANTSAAGSALGTAVSEGMTAYLSDTDELVMYDGTSWFKQNGSTNAIINGAFDIWQRGTSFSNPANTSYLADRWSHYFDGTGATRTISQQTFTPGSAPVAGYEGTYFLRWAQTVAGSGGTYNVLGQRIEDVRMFAGQTVTLSFWAKASSTTTISTDFDRWYGIGGSSAEYVQNSISHSLTTSWARYTATVSVASISGKTIGSSSYLQLNFRFPVNAANTYDIWGVQLEAGSVATPFKRNAPSIQAELAACQRYYVRWGGEGAYNKMGTGMASSTTAARFLIPLPVQMRTAPTSVEYSTLQIDNINAGYAVTSLSLVGSGLENSKVAAINTVVSSGLTTGYPYLLGANNSTSAYLGFSAEL